MNKNKSIGQAYDADELYSDYIGREDVPIWVDRDACLKKLFEARQSEMTMEELMADDLMEALVEDIDFVNKQNTTLKSDIQEINSYKDEYLPLVKLHNDLFQEHKRVKIQHTQLINVYHRQISELKCEIVKKKNQYELLQIECSRQRRIADEKVSIAHKLMRKLASLIEFKKKHSKKR